MLLFALAAKLGRTVAQLKRELSAREWTEWRAYAAYHRGLIIALADDEENSKTYIEPF